MDNKPKVLLVEDTERDRKWLLFILNTAPSEWLAGSGIERFDITIATCVEEARAAIKETRQSGRPFEAILLDMGLPMTPDEVLQLDEQLLCGYQLLCEITENSEAAVFVLTAHPERQNIIRAIQASAVDFFDKADLGTDDGKRDFLVRLVKAVGVTRERVHRRLLAEHAERLAEENAEEVRSLVAQQVTQLADRIAHQIRDITNTLRRRFDFDERRNPEDPLARDLTVIREATDQIVQAVWAKRPDRACEEIKVEDVLNKEVAHAMPCYLHKNVALNTSLEPDLRTKTVEADLRAMIAELILSALEESPKGGRVDLAAARSPGANDIVITVIRGGEAVPEQLMADLTAGRPPGVDLHNRWRNILFLWRLARNLGISMKAEGSGDQNRLTLKIPVIAK
jgi:CheY-like chemotaxis protein